MAHFVAYEGYRERLHGHNYSLSCSLMSSSLNRADGYVVDFGVIKKAVRAVCKSLNERFIVPVRSDVLLMDYVYNKKGAEHLRITCKQDDSVFLFPKSDCFMCPIQHSTVEEICLYMYGAIIEKIGPDYLLDRGVEKCRIGLAEAPGQQCFVDLDIKRGFQRDQWEKSGFNGTVNSPEAISPSADGRSALRGCLRSCAICCSTTDSKFDVSKFGVNNNAQTFS